MNKATVLNAARTIVLNEKAITAHWQQIDYFHQYGISIEQNQQVLKRHVPDLTIGQIVTACFTLPSAITKAKQKYNSMPDGPAKIKLGVEIKIKEQQLAEIKALRE